jgi:hypothetical protein
MRRAGILQNRGGRLVTHRDALQATFPEVWREMAERRALDRLESE